MKSAQNLIYQKIPKDIMNTQINLRLPEKLLISAKKYSEKNGFSSIQELIKETLREKLFPEPEFTKEEIKEIEEYAEYCEKNNLYMGDKESRKALGLD